MQSVQQTYVFNQSNGDVTSTVNGNWLQAYCLYLGVTEPVNSSWLQALCIHFGITAPLYGSWTIALANYYGITQPLNGTWWYALSQAPSAAPSVPFIWNEDTNLWEDEDRVWNIGDPVAPTANFTSTTVTIIEGDSVQFTDTSLGAPTSWAWTFTGAVQESYTTQNPLVTYNTVGSFAVALEVTNTEGSNLKEVLNYMLVNVLPIVADFSGTSLTPIEGDDVIFTDLSTGTPTQWSWSFAGGNPLTSALQNPTVEYTTAGTYTVALTASKTGSTDTETKVDYINVVEPSSVEPITEFATGLYYQNVSNPLSRVDFSNTLIAQKIETTV
jgi:PKD repeat protein|tara:strand:- start:3118 stop:4101 length:984 start_codon:yes stop_codon:yes gene_type:complete